MTRRFAAGWAAQSDSRLGNRSWVSSALGADHRIRTGGERVGSACWGVPSVPLWCGFERDKKRHPAWRALAACLRRSGALELLALRDAGIRQFQDIGTSLLTSPNTHDAAQEGHLDAHVVYVNNDPVVVARPGPG